MISKTHLQMAGNYEPDPHRRGSVTVPVTYTVLMPRCADCRSPMRPEQNARRTGRGWICIPCWERQVRPILDLVVVQPLHRPSLWSRLLAWFRGERVPKATARER